MISRFFSGTPNNPQTGRTSQLPLFPPWWTPVPATMTLRPTRKMAPQEVRLHPLLLEIDSYLPFPWSLQSPTLQNLLAQVHLNVGEPILEPKFDYVVYKV